MEFFLLGVEDGTVIYPILCIWRKLRPRGGMGQGLDCEA